MRTLFDGQDDTADDDPPSPIALWVATLRALHQTVDTPLVFVDPLAVRILGPDGPALIEPQRPRAKDTAPLRATLAARGVVAATAVAEAVARGVQQCVILGAGLDTFAYRHSHAGLHVFEVDHPKGQAWKREALRRANIAPPPTVTYVGVDFETDDFLGALVAARFDPSRAAIFVMLGVSLYLKRDTLLAIFERIGAECAPGTEIVFDFTEPLNRASGAAQTRYQAAAARVAARGEPWLTFFVPAELHAELRRRGFVTILDLDGPALNARLFANRPDGLAVTPLVHLLRARTDDADGPANDPVAKTVGPLFDQDA